MNALRSRSGLLVAAIGAWLVLLQGPLRADPPAPDVDALAARMPKNQDLYQKTRDEALAAYQAQNPKPAPYDDQVREVIRLFAYLSVWDDFYGEDLWAQAVADAKAAQAQGAHDPLLTSFLNVQQAQDFSSATEADAVQANGCTDAFLATAYPPLFKLKVAQAALDNLAGYVENHRPDPTSPSLQPRGRFVQAWGAAYRDLIKLGLPHDWLFDAGDSAQHSVQRDETALDLMIAEQERSFNEADPGNPVRTELDGDFDATDAWNARGTGYANTVTDQGGQLFADRLAKAAAILEPFFAVQPGEVGTCHVMMKVELGQGQGRDRMELWFKRAVAIDPNRFEAYKDKEWYLQPRWYGSLDAVKQFGEECARTQNWGAKVPLILPLALAEATNASPALYQQPDTWAELEAVYRGYLSHYPGATFYRTGFLMHAYSGGHLDVVREQLEILGDNWDRRMLSDARHAAMVAAVGP